MDLITNQSAVALVLPEGLLFEQWLVIGEKLQRAERSLMWWIGDWLRFGERRYGEKYNEAMVVMGKAKATLSDARWVATEFSQITDRSEVLSWTHHRQAARLPAGERRDFMSVCERDSLSVREAMLEVNRRKNAIGSVPHSDTCTVAELGGLIASGRKFGTVYADPPWLYDNQGTRAATGNHYDGMTVEALCRLPISELMLPASHLHLWTTNGFLFECPKIFEAWGMTFKSTFVWTKPQMGIGNYWRNSHEFLLTAVRGDAKRFNDHSLMSWGNFNRTKHSEKPEQIRTFIERASPGPYLELFGRRQVPKWTVWGNQIEKTMFDR